MKLITSERLFALLMVGALIGWSIRFYKQFERPAIGLLEAAFGGWSMLPLTVIILGSITIARIRTNAISDDPAGFYEKGASRYVLAVGTVTASLGLIFLGIRAHP